MMVTMNVTWGIRLLLTREFLGYEVECGLWLDQGQQWGPSQGCFVGLEGSVALSPGPADSLSVLSSHQLLG